MNDKPLPELFSKKEECCGCWACHAICPVQLADGTSAITMSPDDEGFLYPVVDKNKCIYCYKCINVCIFKQQISTENV